MQPGRCVTVRPVRGHFTPKMNITFFYQKLDAEYFFIRQFFRKKQYFRRKLQKLFWGRIWQFFRERRRLASKINVIFLLQMRYWICYYLAVFSKKAEIFKENSKKPFLRPKFLLKGRGRLARKINATFFNRKWGFEYFFI